MRVPLNLFNAFGADFERQIGEFAVSQGLLPDLESLSSHRYLTRSIAPHIQKLSSLFNREEKEQSAALDPYWKESSNPENLRLAYFLYFMPCNLFRIASVWSELARRGYTWNAGETRRGIEFGAGPAPAACAAAAAEKHSPFDLPKTGRWALIEQDKAMLSLGQSWAENYFVHQGINDWGIRPFHRKISLDSGFLPRNAPTFNAWVMSYFLNEFSNSPGEIAKALIESWNRHLDDEGIVILVEPALKLQSRKLLELRRALLNEKTKRGIDWFQILLPCLGHQNCGALAAPEDWCHEEVSWWRPPYFKILDQLCGLDRKTLPFSYLVITKSKRPREEILPALANFEQGQRLVSPAHHEGKELEFFLCGNEGKRRARYRPSSAEDPASELERGDILLGSSIRGDARASRVDKIEKLA
jgi:hypothetical protein